MSAGRMSVCVGSWAGDAAKYSSLRAGVVPATNIRNIIVEMTCGATCAISESPAFSLQFNSSATSDKQKS